MFAPLFHTRATSQYVCLSCLSRTQRLRVVLPHTRQLWMSTAQGTPTDYEDESGAYEFQMDGGSIKTTPDSSAVGLSNFEKQSKDGVTILPSPALLDNDNLKPPNPHTPAGMRTSTKVKDTVDGLLVSGHVEQGKVAAPKKRKNRPSNKPEDQKEGENVTMEEFFSLPANQKEKNTTVPNEAKASQMSIEPTTGAVKSNGIKSTSLTTRTTLEPEDKGVRTPPKALTMTKTKPGMDKNLMTEEVQARQDLKLPRIIRELSRPYGVMPRPNRRRRFSPLKTESNDRSQMKAESLHDINLERIIARMLKPKYKSTESANAVSTATDKLVHKLDTIIFETFRTATKRVLVRLLQGNAINNRSKLLVKRQLQKYLVTPHTTIDIAQVVKDAKLERSTPKATSTNPRKTKMRTKMKNMELQNTKGTVELQTIEAADLHLVPVDKIRPEMPRLSYGLERVLFNPGVYQLRDPRSGVFNFDPYLQSIMPVQDFDFNALKEYITSSRDESLMAAAVSEKKKYTGSTSSMTSALAHFHYLLSQWRPLNLSSLSQGFPIEYRKFTTLQRSPAALFLRWKDGTYAIDADKEFDSSNILMMLGKSMEKLLTLSTADYERYRIENSAQISEEERNQPESFHYTTMGDFLMRSQLDAYDPRLPGSGVFDIKTRAVVSIRMDAVNYENGLGYEIIERHGKWESYEREYYDMIRAAFLKYSLQVRMGRMDGIFVAFHNTQKIFGFQYVSIAEMDNAIHGTDDVTTGDSEFKLSVDLLNKVLNRATAQFPEQSIRLHFETRESTVAPFMYIFAEPIAEEEITEIQEAKKAQVADFEAQVLRLDREQTQEGVNGLGMEEWDESQDSDRNPTESNESELYAIDGSCIGKDTVEVVKESDDHPVSKIMFEKTMTAVGEFVSAVNLAANETEERDAEMKDEMKSAKDDEDETDGRQYTSVVRQTTIYGDQADNIRDEIPNTYGNTDTNQVWSLGKRVENEKMQADFDNHGNQRAIVSEGVDSDGSYRATINDDLPSLNTEDKVTEIHGGQLSDAQHPPANEKENEGGENLAQDETIQSETPLKPLLAMILTISNKVNDKNVLRPEHLKANDRWSVEYRLDQEQSLERAHKLYKSLRARRAAMLNGTDSFWNQKQSFVREIAHFVRVGRKRAQEQKMADESGIVKRIDIWEPNR